MEKSIDNLSAKEVIDRFNLTTLEGEGGFFAPLQRHDFGSSVIFLTTEVDYSAWHKIKENEYWIHIAGAPLTLHTLDSKKLETVILDRSSVKLEHMVKSGVWMAAESTGLWSLVICTVTPAFDGMDLASEKDFQQFLKIDPTVEPLKRLLPAY